MSDIAIRVENISKRYRIGAKEQVHETLTSALLDFAKRPLRNLRDLRRLSRFDGQEEKGDDILWALKDVSFEVKRGEVVGIIGRNGAGKSTLLKILSRITRPSSGRVVLNGRVASLLEVGTGFHPDLSGRENIYLNGTILGMTKAEIDRKFDEIVDFSGVERFIDTPVKRFSSGMYVRLAFAVAAHLEPEILLVDEVLAVGDAEFQKKCLGKMGDVAREGRTVLFVSHNMHAIEQLCSEAVLLFSGRLKRSGKDVRHIVTDYLQSVQEQPILGYWKNAGSEYENPLWKPLRFFVADIDGNLLQTPVRNDSEIWIFVEGESQVEDSSLTIGYAVYSEAGELIYWSFHTDQGPEHWPKLKAGHFSLKGRIPMRVLNEGTYTVELLASRHFIQWLLEPGHNVPRVKLSIQGGLSDSPFWMIKRPGVIAPVLEWQLVS